MLESWRPQRGLSITLMRKNIITQAWLAEFYAEGVKPKYKGSLKRQATSNKPQAQPEVASDKPQAVENEELEGLKKFVRHTKKPI